MMKPQVVASTLFLLISLTGALAQETTDISNVTVFTILNPGLSHERKIGKDQSVYGQIFMNTSIFLGYSSSLGNSSSISFDPAISAQYRYYYNGERRLAKGKRTALNSMNFLSVLYEATFTDDRISVSDYDEENVRAIHQFGICWGIQRNYASKFSLNLTLGIGYFYTKVTTPDSAGQPVPGHTGGLNTLGQLNLGIWLNKRNPGLN